ncbi:MAG: hypothetical protein N2442_10030 [Spirochaetes bacterium]|nr:hypothetical protein [Spirochaetota bacterium]
MLTPIVITEQEFEKGKDLFTSYTRYNWQISSPVEASVAEAIRSSGARIAVLGTERYRGPLYETLAENAKGSPALIVRYGVGFDGIDVGQCKTHGIFLCITPGALDESVAEHTIALLLGLARHIPYCHGEFLQGRFTRRTGFELAGKRLGLVGFGNIAKRVAEIASLGLRMRVTAYGRTPLEQKAAKEGFGPLEYLSRYHLEAYHTDFVTFAKNLQILSLLLPVRPETIQFLNQERINALPRGVYLINTGRGKLVDEEALYDALASGHLAGAALDVFTQEPYVPASADKDLRKLGNVVLTPHVASDTREANRNMQELILRNIEAFLSGEFQKLTLAPMAE